MRLPASDEANDWAAVVVGEVFVVPLQQPISTDLRRRIWEFHGSLAKPTQDSLHGRWADHELGGLVDGRTSRRRSRHIEANNDATLHI